MVLLLGCALIVEDDVDGCIIIGPDKAGLALGLMELEKKLFGLCCDCWN